MRAGGPGPAARLGCAALLLALSPAAAQTISGTVTLRADGTPVANIPVGATRVVSLAGLQPPDRIPIEWVVWTAADGSYSVAIPPATPGIDRFLVYTVSTMHFNQVRDGVETSGCVARVADTTRPGVREVDLTLGDAAGIDFALDSNRTTWSLLMRDGVTHLATDVYLPARAGSFPVMMQRTPYNKATDHADAAFVLYDYAMVVQDDRGRFASEGEDRAFRDDGWGENQDGYDTVEWIAAQPWFGGRIGTFGSSARAITQYLLAGSLPPVHTCGVPVVGSANLYEDVFYPGGVFLKNLVEWWLGLQGNSDYLPVLESHPDYDDYWRGLDLATRAPQVTVPFLHIGGWFDSFDQGTVDAFDLLQHQGGLGARGSQKLVMGPWTHGLGGPQVGELTFPANVADVDLGALQLRWFEYWLRGVDNGIMSEPAVLYYTMGDVDDPAAPGNVWRQAGDWPLPAAPVPFYLRAAGTLSEAPPAPAEPSDAYSYDPVDPAPTLGGQNVFMAAGPYDQRSVESRDDVLVYTSGPLAAPVEVTGRVLARLWASTDAPDTDWAVKLTDVYPDGRSMLVLDGILRARHRVSTAREDFPVPGRPHLYEVDLWSTSLVFNAGHRIRVDVSSSNDPRFDPNPNTGHPFRADTETRVARNTIHHEADLPSYVLLPVVKATGGACATTTEPGLLRVRKLAAGGIVLSWGDAAHDPCFEAWRVYASDDPSSWSAFAPNLLAETQETLFAGDPPYGFYLVTAAATDGTPGPSGHF